MRTTVALVCFLSCSIANAEEAKSYEVETRQDIAYSKEKDADKTRHKLDVYLPKNAKNYPILFFIHGGGWRNGNKNGFAGHGKMFASHGIGFVATNYRLTPAVKHPDHAKDVAAAFTWVVTNLGKEGADLKRIYVSGHSAGGHLAALLATDASYLKHHKLSLKDIKGVIPVSGVFSISGERMAEAFGDEDSRKSASPMTHVREGLPPFLILYADKEIAGLGKQAEAFSKALQGEKVSNEVKMIANRDHGSIMRNIAKADDDATKLIFKFINGK